MWDPVPPSKDNPVFQLENVIVTPHTGGDTQESRSRLAVMAARSLLAALDGEPFPLNWANRKAMGL